MKPGGVFGWVNQESRSPSMNAKRLLLAISFFGMSGLSGLAYSQVLDYGGNGEGWTSTPGSEGVRVGSRMFTAPQLTEICPIMGVPAKLVVPDRTLRLVVGEWFFLNHLTIYAVDSEGRAINPVPMGLLVESPAIEILNLRSDTLSGGRLLPIRAGDFRLRVQTICDDRPVEAFIQVTVVER